MAKAWTVRDRNGQLLAQSASRPALQEWLASLSQSLFDDPPKNLRWHLDVDPIEFD